MPVSGIPKDWEQRKDSGVDMDVEFYARRTVSLAKLDSHFLDIFYL